MTQRYVDTANIKIAIVDDHTLFRRGLAKLINHFNGYTVMYDLDNGRELQKVLEDKGDIDLVLLDVNVPVMSGYEIAGWMREHYPEIRILAVSMENKEDSICRMLDAGARGYILKDAETSELKDALDNITHKGYYHSELVCASFFNRIHKKTDTSISHNLNNREMEFLKLACSDFTYKEIADKMHLAPRTIDGYRESLFEKLHVKSRVGLVMYAIKNNLVIL